MSTTLGLTKDSFDLKGIGGFERRINECTLTNEDTRWKLRVSRPGSNQGRSFRLQLDVGFSTTRK